MTQKHEELKFDRYLTPKSQENIRKFSDVTPVSDSENSEASFRTQVCLGPTLWNSLCKELLKRDKSDDEDIFGSPSHNIFQDLNFLVFAASQNVCMIFCSY